MTWAGIDVSRHNGAVDWARVARNGVQFAILRATYGKTGVDERFAEFYRGARAAGLAVGAYHYSYALTPRDAAREARHCLRQLAGYPLDLPLWLDMEDADGYKKKHGFLFNRKTVTALCTAFLAETDRAGQPCGIYANLDWLTRYITVPPGHDVWLAQWAVRPAYPGSIAVWQYTDSGRVDGVRGAVDRNICYKDYFTKEDDPMIVYKMPADLPDWAQPTVEKLIGQDWLRPEPDGSVNLSLDMARVLVINDRAGLYGA